MTAKQLESIAQRRLEKAAAKVEQEIAKAYRRAREEIKTEIAEAYEKYAIEGKLTRAEMAKYNRNITLEKNLTKLLGDADAQAIRLGKRLTKEQYEESFFLRAWSLDNQMKSRLRWGTVSQEAVRAIVENDLAKIARTRLKRNSRERIRSAIASGLTRGDSYAQMAEQINGVIKGSRSDALRIARTEAHRAQVEGGQKAYEKADDLGIAGNQYWIATLDDRTRDRHGELDGKPRDKEKGGWRVPGTNTYTPGPSQSGIASFDINCRCAVEYRVDDDAPSVRRIRGEGEKPYITYEDWKKERG